MRFDYLSDDSAEILQSRVDEIISQDLRWRVVNVVFKPPHSTTSTGTFYAFLEHENGRLFK